MLKYSYELDKFTSVCNCTFNPGNNEPCIVESLCVLGMTCREVENAKLKINPILVPGCLLDTKGFC